SVALPAPPPNKPSATEVITLVLNGITSPPRRTAIVNNRTFERGEEGEVHLPNGNKVLIRCEEIRADSAIISVGGVRRELKLRSGL
ncbi:MAG TPA: hypothetical protein VKY92_15595, partial [Verrucomicrobiae bacterium]|nr:hypothetical protein [Verrucomicrobiae bacterium]